jgi:hypothetical protein
MAAPKTIQELVDALKNAPQEKEGAFRIATWRMVLEAFAGMQNRIATLEASLGVVQKTADAAASKTVDTEAIKRAVKDDISKADANKILF